MVPVRDRMALATAPREGPSSMDHRECLRPTGPRKLRCSILAALRKPNPPNDKGSEAESVVSSLLKKLAQGFPDPLIMRPGELSNCIWFNHSEEVIGLGKRAMQQQ